MRDILSDFLTFIEITMPDPQTNDIRQIGLR